MRKSVRHERRGWAALFAMLLLAIGTIALAAGVDPCARAAQLEQDVVERLGMHDEEEAYRRDRTLPVGGYCVQYWRADRETVFGHGGIRVVTIRDDAVDEAFWMPITFLQLWLDEPGDGLEIGQDITDNGLPNLVIWLITGGDCCVAMLILELGDGVRVVYDDREGRHGEAVVRALRDLTGDGRMEIVATDADSLRWSCLNEAGIDLVTTSVWRYEPTFGDDQRGAYVAADPARFPEVFEPYIARGEAILAYDGTHAFDPNEVLDTFPRDMRDYHVEQPRELARVCRLLPLGTALADAGRYDDARALLPADVADRDAWPWSEVTATFDREAATARNRGQPMFERLTCPSGDTPGAVVLLAYGGHAITGWALTAGRDDLLGAVRVDLADGRSWCFARTGGHVTLSTGARIGTRAALADLTGSGQPDVLIQVHGRRTCEQFAYVLELGPEPRLVFEAASWVPDRHAPHGYPVCPFALVDLDGDGRFELVTADSYWTNPGVTLPSCSHALAPYVPVALSYADGGYRVVDPLDPREAIESWALGALHDAYLGGWLREYARLGATEGDERFDIEHRCVVAGIVLPWFYLRQPERARAVFDVLYQLDDREATWERVLESVRASPYVGGWYR